MKVAIIDYGMGNLRNVEKAFLSIGIDCVITNDRQKLKDASKIVLPGVGAFKDAIATLNETELGALTCQMVKEGKPTLGICLGMQLLFEKSYENGNYTGLGLLPGEIVKLDVPLKVPHMGWNTLEITKTAPLYEGIKDQSYVYFVHSYYVETTADVISCYTDYGKRIAVAAQKDNLFATQFHPEKSGEVGLQILRNFAAL